jgi:DNA-binding NarL/FixJ family response regulator
MTIGTIHILEDIAETQQWLYDIASNCFPSAKINTAETVKASLAAITTEQPDLALIDLGLPDGSGVDVIKALNATSPATLVIVTTIFDDDIHLFSALRAGAHGYVLKHETEEVVTALIKGAADGKPALSPPIAKRLLSFFQPLSEPSPNEHLTERETEVLRLIAKGYSTLEAADLLGITRNTTAGYIKIIYRKLNISSRAEASTEASKQGIISINAK